MRRSAQTYARSMYRFLAGLFAGFAITHLGYALFADMKSLQFFGRTWSSGFVWGEVVIYTALMVLFAYLGWSKARR